MFTYIKNFQGHVKFINFDWKSNFLIILSKFFDANEMRSLYWLLRDFHRNFILEKETRQKIKLKPSIKVTQSSWYEWWAKQLNEVYILMLYMSCSSYIHKFSAVYFLRRKNIAYLHFICEEIDSPGYKTMKLNCFVFDNIWSILNGLVVSDL